MIDDGDDVWTLMLFEEGYWIVGGHEQSRQQLVGEGAFPPQSQMVVDIGAAAVGPLELRSRREYVQDRDDPILVPGNWCYRRRRRRQSHHSAVRRALPD